MSKVYSRTKGILPDTVSGFCPGCMHGTVHKLIGEAAEELGQLEKLVRVEGVGCCGLGQFYVTVIFVNNGIYGMTGGQMAPTTLIGMNSTTTPEGREPEVHGYPMHIVEILNQLTAPYYLERVSCNTPQNVIKARKAIKKAFQYQLEGKGFSLVEIVTSCPTNWGMSTLDSLKFLEKDMFDEYPLGLVRDKGAEAK